MKILRAHVLIILFLGNFALADKLPSPVSGADRFLKLHPESDTNKDGVLTKEEQLEFNVKHTVKLLGGGYAYERVMVPMRDGVKLATAVFIPKGGKKYSAVMTRTAYGVWAAAFFDTAKFANQDLVFITQDLRGDGESEGAGTADLTSFDNEIDDGYDTIEWVKRQKWSNGNIGMIGQSGHGFCGYMGYLAKHPSLSVVDTNISGGNAHLYWTHHNGVRGEMYTRWIAQRGIPIKHWPRPSVDAFDRAAYAETVKKASVGNDTVFIARTGWYDIFAESALDYFGSFAQNGRVFVQVDASGHGEMRGRAFPKKPVPAEWVLPSAQSVLAKGKEAGAPAKSRMVYYLMGDCVDENAPGNHYKMTEVWPVPHTPTAYYFQADGSLTPTKSTEEKASLSYKYDPRNPVPSQGGDVFVHKGVGPLDQRVLKERKDILRFTSETLTAPLEITGKVMAELYVSSDVADTTFTAKLIDVYPDGYEAIVRDSIIMGRYHEGFDKQSPMKKGQVYKLIMDMWSTALVVNKGHRLAVHISSSNSPKYEVHPNSYEAVTSMKLAPVAKNTIHLSSEHPSKIILPVVKE